MARALAANASIFDDLSIEALRRRRSYKWSAFPSDVLPAFVAEMDFPLAPPISRALVEAVEEDDCGYAVPSNALTQALRGFEQQRFGWDVGDSTVSVIPDVLVGITEFLRVAVEPGAGVVINTPVYPPFFSHIAMAGCRVVDAPLAQAGQNYELDLDAVEHAFQSGARAYLLCNPHNPTGNVFTRSELTHIAELAERYDVVVLADEIHSPLVLSGVSHTPFLSLGEAAQARGVALVSASKAWNTPGLKCAQLVAGAGPMEAVVNRLPEDLAFRASNLGIYATIAAYRDSVAWLDDLLQVLDRNRVLLSDLLAERLPAVRYSPPQGGYLAWLDCRELDLPEEPVDFFLKHGRVALGPGPNFGKQGQGYVRVTMGTSAGILTQIVQRMRLALTD